MRRDVNSSAAGRIFIIFILITEYEFWLFVCVLFQFVSSKLNVISLVYFFSSWDCNPLMCFLVQLDNACDEVRWLPVERWLAPSCGSHDVTAECVCVFLWMKQDLICLLIIEEISHFYCFCIIMFIFYSTPSFVYFYVLSSQVRIFVIMVKSKQYIYLRVCLWHVNKSSFVGELS